MHHKGRANREARGGQFGPYPTGENDNVATSVLNSAQLTSFNHPGSFVRAAGSSYPRLLAWPLQKDFPLAYDLVFPLCCVGRKIIVWWVGRARR